LPYLRFGIAVTALFLVARLLLGLTLNAATETAKLAPMPYQRGQFWVRRFRQQAEKLCLALAARMAPPEAPDFGSRALQMLESVGWIAAHRFLFADLRVHLLGWPAFLAPAGRMATPACPQLSFLEIGFFMGLEWPRRRAAPMKSRTAAVIGAIKATPSFLIDRRLGIASASSTCCFLTGSSFWAAARIS
jgi:hypothetical protein